jgi:hypothetical protein
MVRRGGNAELNDGVRAVVAVACNHAENEPPTTAASTSYEVQPAPPADYSSSSRC